MNLDNPNSFRNLDTQDMLSQINGLPGQLQTAWELGMNLKLPDWTGIQQVLIAGMGGSAIGADLLAAYIAPFCTIPFFVHRDYDLPAWAKGPKTLVVASSHSGNTEEVLSSFETALTRGCKRMAITTGGALAKAALKDNIPVWEFKHKGQPRAAVGYSFGLLLAAMHRLGFIPNPSTELDETVQAMQSQREWIKPEISTAQNPAKRIAEQLIDRWISVFGAGILAPVARRWKGQMSEIAKAWAQFEFLPESDHNTLAGVMNPNKLHQNFLVLFLRSPSDHPRNHQRIDLTGKIFTQEGLKTQFIDARGDTRLAHLWTSLNLGDYVAYYLAMAYNVDPTPVSAIENFKREMAAAG